MLSITIFSVPGETEEVRAVAGSTCEELLDKVTLSIIRK